MASNPEPDALRPIRMLTLAVAAALVLLVPAALALVSRLAWPDPWVWIVLLVSGAYCAGASALAPRMVKPPAPGFNGDPAYAHQVMRGVAWLRVTVAASPALIALGLSLWLDTLIPYLVAVPISVGILLATYPRQATIAAIRSRLEVSSQ